MIKADPVKTKSRRSLEKSTMTVRWRHTIGRKESRMLNIEQANHELCESLHIDLSSLSVLETYRPQAMGSVSSLVQTGLRT
jgi:hypothetical protein